MRKSTWTPVALFVVGALAVAGASLAPTGQPKAANDAQLVVARAEVCPVLEGAGQLVGATGQTAVKDLAGAPVTGAQKPGGVTKPIVVQGSGLLPPGVDVEGSNGRTFVACTEPSPGAAVQFADPSTSELVLVNPDRNDAVVNLSIQSGDGDITSAGSRGIAVAAGSSRVVPISVLANTKQPVTVVQQSTQGRVLMVARPTDKKAEQVSGQTPSKSPVIAGLPQNSKAVHLLLGNPGPNPATVQVQALGARGAFTPSGGQNVTLEAGTTLSVDLTAGLRGDQVALRLSSDQEVVATAIAEVGNDVAWIKPAEQATTFSDVAAGPELQLANLGTVPASVQVQGADDKVVSLTVPAGALATTPTATGGKFSVRSNQPLVAADVISSNGVAVQSIRSVQAAGQASQTEQDPALR